MNLRSNLFHSGIRMLRVATLVVSLTGFALTSGCYKGSQQMAYVSDQRFPPKPETAEIAILDGKPGDPYVVVGNVTAWADMTLHGAIQQTAIDRIKTMARQMGGDAIIDYEGRTAPAGTVGSGSFTAQGTVIRWKNSAPNLLK